MTVPAFFAREKPISRNAKPACMNMTRQPATITQIELIPIESGIPFLPTASMRSASGRDNCNLLRVGAASLGFGLHNVFGQRSEIGAGLFAPRSKTRPMPRFEVSRTLVKSPPELWAELGAECLEPALGAVSVAATVPQSEMTIARNGGHATAVLEAAGWGTKVTLTAETEEQVAKAGFWGRLRAPQPPPKHDLEEKLSEVLDGLGSAHKRPFSRG